MYRRIAIIPLLAGQAVLFEGIQSRDQVSQMLVLDRASSTGTQRYRSLAKWATQLLTLQDGISTRT
jgi:hypothetical protein